VSRLLAAITRLPQRLLVALVQGYRLLLKPWLGNACRFEPTCSAYALQALEQHGAVVGATLGVGRVLRCNPWCDGGCDPVPTKAPRLFTRLGLGERESTLDKKKLT
jgi:putative membrane protein insertion efficiency factor